MIVAGDRFARSRGVRLFEVATQLAELDFGAPSSASTTAARRREYEPYVIEEIGACIERVEELGIADRGVAMAVKQLATLVRRPEILGSEVASVKSCIERVRAGIESERRALDAKRAAIVEQQRAIVQSA